MSDPLLLSTPDGAEIESINGVVTLTDGIESAILLSLTGGNSDDPGRSDKTHEFWGNLTAKHPHERLRSEFAHLADGMPLTSGTLRQLEDAARRDLAWLTEPGPTGVTLAESVELTIRSPGRNMIFLSGSVRIDGKAYPFSTTKTKSI